MKINVLKTKETLSVEEALDVKGGLNSTFGMVATECTCDCYISNTNDKTIITPSKPIKSLHE
jgi:hypothetical protein